MDPAMTTVNGQASIVAACGKEWRVGPKGGPDAKKGVGGPEGSKEAAVRRRTEIIPRVGPTLRNAFTFMLEPFE